METVDDCGAAQPCGGTLAARAARPWQALTASLSVVICCFVWLCIRQCNEFLRTRGEQVDGERAAAGVLRAHARAAEAADQAEYTFLAMLNPMLGLATALLVIPIDAQPRMPAVAISGFADHLLYLFNGALDFSGLDTGHLALEQRAFAPENLVDHAVNVADVWADQPTIGWWMGDLHDDGRADLAWQTSMAQAVADFHSDNRLDISWQDVSGTPAISLTDGLNVQSGDNVGFNPGPAWLAHGDGTFSEGLAGVEWQHSDAIPAAWLMDGFDLVPNADIAFHPAMDWHGTQQNYDLV
jgi:hypothetical protein